MLIRRIIITAGLAMLLPLLATRAFGQKWEFGGAGGGSLYKSETITNASGSASAGFDTGYAVSVLLGHNKYNYVGGEIRYTYQNSNMKLSAGGTKATFSSLSHAVHYDLLLHFRPRGSKIRPFLAIGGGAKFYRGTGTEVVFQPLSNIALLTHTQETQGLISTGAGVKIQIAEHLSFRAEVRDYITPFPKKVIEPVFATSAPDWLHNFVPLVGISYTF
jgi:hypothetical protein